MTKKGTKLSEEARRNISLGHKGIKHTAEHRKNVSLSKMGEKNGMWKANTVSYTGLHAWVNSNLPRPELCQVCNLQTPYDVANISGQYLRDLTDYRWLCRKCHMVSDGRLEQLIINGRKSLASIRLKRIQNEDEEV